MRETWYVTEGGDSVDPNEVAPDEKGLLRHKSGAAIAMKGDVPSSRGVDPDEERAKAKPVKAEPKATYKTRESKAR